MLVIEGLDGVGKSSVGKELASRLNYNYVENTLQEMFSMDKTFNKKFREKIDSIFYSEDLIINAWLTSLGNIYQTRKYSEKNVVIDRGVVSNYTWNYNEKTKEIFDVLMNIISDDIITIILYASVECRISRIKNRNINDFDLSQKYVYEDLYYKMLECVRKYNIQYFLIDTENKTIEDIVNEIIIKLSKIGIKPMNV